MLPASFSFWASGDLSSELITMGWQVRPRTLAMKAVLVPLPAPGAPPSRMISFGKRICSWPNSASSSRQMEPKISWASLISRSLRLGAAGAIAAGAWSMDEVIGVQSEPVEDTRRILLTHAVSTKSPCQRRFSSASALNMNRMSSCSLPWLEPSRPSRRCWTGQHYEKRSQKLPMASRNPSVCRTRK
jgi:hypothetical protein